MTHVVVGVGTNIDREINARKAVSSLRAQFGSLRLSPVYESAALGFDGPAFYNFVAAFETTLPLDKLIQQLKSIESASGREHGEKKYSSRALDLDVLLFGAHDCRTEGGNIPRDEIKTAAHVLKPLADLLPNASCVLFGETFSVAWAQFEAEQSDLGIEQIEFDFQ